MKRLTLLLLTTALAMPAAAQDAPSPATIQLPMLVGGRAVPSMDGKGKLSQWPGIYYEARFDGTAVTVRLNDSVNRVRILVDGQVVDEESRPGSGDIDLGPLPAGPHDIRLEKLSESQDAAAEFPGFFVTPDVKPLPPQPRARQIEFIGDSYTVGYGNTAGKRQCTRDEVWATTDTSQAFGPLTAKHYNADYQVNAISGHGIVRNYGGGAGDPVPVAYPFVLFDKLIRYNDAAWKPQIIVIGLGTNDFSTPLNSGEKWGDRNALHADYETTYVKFVQDIRARNPQAFFILMATDGFDGEIQAEVNKVVAKLNAAGETRVAFLPMNGLGFGGCDWHPDTTDDKAVEGVLQAYIDAHPELWQGK